MCFTPHSAPEQESVWSMRVCGRSLACPLGSQVSGPLLCRPPTSGSVEKERSNSLTPCYTTAHGLAATAVPPSGGGRVD